MFKSFGIIFYNILLQRPDLFCYILVTFFYCLTFILLFSVLQEKKKLFLNANKGNYISVHKLLNYYYTYNIYSEILLLCILFLISLGVLLILRFFNLGKTYNLWFAFSNIQNIPFSGSIFIIFTFLAIISLLKVIFLFLQDIFYKIYLYFIINEKFYDFIYNIGDRYTDNLLICLRIYTTLLTLQENNQEKRYIQGDYVLYKKTDFMYFCMDIFNKYYILLYLLNRCIWLYKAFSLILVCETLREKGPLIILYLIFLYDLKDEKIHFTYYMLLVFLLITLYRRFCRFISQLDMYEIDLQLVKYYYGKVKCENHAALAGKTKSEMVLGIGIDISNIYEDIEQVKEYFNKGFVVNYIDIKFKKSYEPISIRFIFIAIIVFYYMFCYNLNIKDSIIISMPLFLAILIYEYAYYFRDIIKKKLVYIISYKIFLLLSIMLGIWVYVTRHTLHFYTDILWSFGFEIKQTFTTVEKQLFMERYSIYFIEYCTLLSSYEKTELFYLLTNVTLMVKEVTIVDMDIEMFKIFIENTLYDYINLKKYYVQETLLIQKQTLFDKQFT